MSSKNKSRHYQNPMASGQNISAAIDSEEKVEPVAATSETPVETPVTTQETPKVEETKVETPEAPKVETPVEVPQPKQETPKPEVKKEEPKEEKKTVETPKKKGAINISTDIEVRYAATFSNKRIATIRKMPLYTIIYTYIHNRSAFLGLVNASQMDEIFQYILGNNIVIEGVKISDQLKKDLYLKIKSDTDYVKIKWGSK